MKNMIDLNASRVYTPIPVFFFILLWALLYVVAGDGMIYKTCAIFYQITNFYFTYLQRLRADSIEENLNSTAFIFLKDCLEVIIDR